jgi:hypothetical protein
MKSVDLERLRGVVSSDYTAAVERQYGDIGMQRLRELTVALDVIHDALAYELLQDGLTVLAALDPAARPLPNKTTLRVTAPRLPTLVRGRATIQVLSDGGLLLSLDPLDPRVFERVAVVYHFDGADHFVVGGALHDVFNPTPFPSIWGIPTFFELDDALEYYRDSIALVCDCDILANELWHDPTRRWILRNKPEDTMQRSLWRYLRTTMRGTNRVVEVDREQPVAGRRPPDIKITWSQTKRIALVEVKWMGQSVNDTGTGISGFQPDEGNANEGAQQLADYLDANFRRAPEHQTKGYLVVFDARRRNLGFSTTELSYDDAMYYLMRDIEWVPDHSTRYDMATPMRCFVKPLRPAA